MFCGVATYWGPKQKSFSPTLEYLHIGIKVCFFCSVQEQENSSRVMFILLFLESFEIKYAYS